MGALKVVPVVVDTNVIVSALLFGGQPGRLMSLWQNGGIKPIASKPMMDELLRVLAYPRFDLTAKEIEYLLYRQILPYVDIIDVLAGGISVSEDPSDDIFIHCALEAGVHYIISGDQHLLKLKNFEQIAILTVREFLKNMDEIFGKGVAS